MVPHFDESGLLPPGIHWASWEEFADRFGGTHWRRMMLSGLRAAMLNLKGAGCQTIYVDGSFVTSKEVPNDYDACWNEAGVDPTTLDRVLLMTSIPGRDIQKARYLGEFFPGSEMAGADGLSFLEFFQKDKETERPKGVVAMDLGELR